MATDYSLSLIMNGIPWNNNNAEHAVHHFAKLRRIADGTFTQSPVEQLLVLLSVLETCEYRRVNPLKFLLSGQRRFRELGGFSNRARPNLIPAHGMLEAN